MSCPSPWTTFYQVPFQRVAFFIVAIAPAHRPAPAIQNPRYRLNTKDVIRYFRKLHRLSPVILPPWTDHLGVKANMASTSLDGKVALITGASSGIGRATAVYLAARGVNLCISGRNEDELRTTFEQCKSQAQSSSDMLMIPADLTVETDVERLVANTIGHFKKLDGLVNNAGIVFNGSIETTSLKEYDQLMNINVRSIYHLTMLCVPHLIASKGAIVNVSSVNGVRAFQNCLAYCMSKSALDQFTRCVALELASKGVRVNSVNPGVIITNIHRRGGKTEDEYQAFLEHSKTTHALGRVGQPEEVAKAISFLLSDDSSFTTGAQLLVDGGRHAMCPR